MLSMKELGVVVHTYNPELRRAGQKDPKLQVPRCKNKPGKEELKSESHTRHQLPLRSEGGAEPAEEGGPELAL